MARPHQNMTRRYADDLRLFRTRREGRGSSCWSPLWLLRPFLVDDFWLAVLIYAGIAAIGAIGLNLLTGYTGQVSLGHAFFLGCRRVRGRRGRRRARPAAVALAARGRRCSARAVGALVGPFALRLRGNYLAIVTLGLVFLGEHIFRNSSRLTGGNSGTSVTRSGHARADRLQRPRRSSATSTSATRACSGWSGGSSRCARCWPRTSCAPARAGRCRRSATATSPPRSSASSSAATRSPRSRSRAPSRRLAGALYGAYQQFVSPDEWSLFLSIQFIAIIIVGGVGTVFGPSSARSSSAACRPSSTTTPTRSPAWARRTTGFISASPSTRRSSGC